MNCPVCNSEKNKFEFKGRDILYQMVEDEFSILSCQNCRAMFIDPFPSRERTNDFYPKNYYSYETSEPKGFFEDVKKKIIKFHTDPDAKLGIFDKLLVMIFKSKFSGMPLYKKEGGNFLDIGCGNGVNLKTVKNYGWDAYGIELDKNAVEYARRLGLNVECVGLEEADFSGKKFDCIRIWHVFEHLTNPKEAMAKIAGMLNDDGEILMAVPNSDSFSKKLFRSCWYALDAPRHVINYCPKTLRYLCKKNNLKIEKIVYASCGSYVGSLSNFLRSNFGYKKNLINNLFLIALFSPLDFLSDFMNKGDTIFLTIKKL
jgi:2-polyprenyl-3-methyl-5-hydroxy-6-metoxy-1,4-benzoquinol methylase